MPKNKVDKDLLKRINLFDFESKDSADIDPTTIPNLIPNASLKEWQDGDTDPYYKVQKIGYPIKANGIWYNESFFESFLGKLNSRPIPGSRNGHTISWGEKGKTDFVLIGGKIEKNGDGSGSVYFKNYIPPVGESGDNSIFIKENKSGMVHFSLVTYPKELREEDSDGNIKYTAIESIFGERNDAVEYGTGAMAQVTNKTDGGAIDDNQNIEEENVMDKDEILKRLANMFQNGSITLREVASAVGKSGDLVTEAHKNALKMVEDLKAVGVVEPVKEFETMKNKAEVNFESVKNARITEAFGASEKDENGEEKNLLHSYAFNQLKTVLAEDLEKAINGIKEDPVAKHLASQAADYKNQILTVDGKQDDDSSDEVEVLVL